MLTIIPVYLFSLSTRKIRFLKPIFPIDGDAVSHAEEKENPNGCKLSGKKHPVIIHLMATIVLIRIASIWILFQMLAGTETSQRTKKKNPHVAFYCESCFCSGSVCDRCYKASLSEDRLGPGALSWVRSGLEQPRGDTHCLCYPPEALHLAVR